MPRLYLPLTGSGRILIALVCLLGVAVTAYAQSATREHAALLGSSSDSRVRTQAALTLGASRSPEAVKPLCDALGDKAKVVRLAAATALGRLRKGGKACLRKRLDAEADAGVKASIQKALALVDGQAGESEPSLTGTSTLYVAVDKLAGPERFDQKVRGAFVKGASNRADIAFAPRNEAVGEAGRLLKGHSKVRAYALAPKVSRPKYNGGTLQITLATAIFSYPERALIGNFSQSAAASGVTEPDAAAEEELLLAVAEASMAKFLAIEATLGQE